MTLLEAIKEKHENNAQLITETAKLKLEALRDKENYENSLRKQDIYISELKSQISKLEQSDSLKLKEITNLRAVEKTLVEQCELHVNFNILPPEYENSNNNNEKQEFSLKIKSLENTVSDKEQKIQDLKNLIDAYLVFF